MDALNSSHHCLVKLCQSSKSRVMVVVTLGHKSDSSRSMWAVFDSLTAPLNTEWARFGPGVMRWAWCGLQPFFLWPNTPEIYPVGLTHWSSVSTTSTPQSSCPGLWLMADLKDSRIQPKKPFSFYVKASSNSCCRINQTQPEELSIKQARSCMNGQFLNLPAPLLKKLMNHLCLTTHRQTPCSVN